MAVEWRSSWRLPAVADSGMTVPGDVGGDEDAGGGGAGGVACGMRRRAESLGKTVVAARAVVVAQTGIAAAEGVASCELSCDGNRCCLVRPTREELQLCGRRRVAAAAAARCECGAAGG